MPETKRPAVGMDGDDLALAATAAPSLASASVSAGSAGATFTEDTPPPSGAPPSADASIVGALLAHYRVDELLGKGGMGEVYLATDIALDRQVALKLLPRHSARDPQYRARFLREARSQARLNHPNVCHIYFVGEQNDQLFFAMELIDGETLGERLERCGPIPPEDAIEYCRMAALGLREAHRHGYIHRDIKPSNLVLDEHGVVKLVDFGIVKAPDDRGETGAVMGTPFYMSPEQARGEAVDFRSDIYSLGATLHQLLTGAPPFAGATPEAVLSQQISGTRPPVVTPEAGRRQRDTALINQLCDRMMAKRPGDRFASYEELLAALDQLSPNRTREAGFWVRFAAAAFDFVFALFLALPLTGIWDYLVSKPLHRESASGWLPFLLCAFYEIAQHARTGQTWGKRLFEIEVVRTDGAGRVGWGRAALRFFVQWGISIGALFGLSMVDDWKLPDSVELVVYAVLLILLFCGPLGLGAIAMRRMRGGTVWDAVARTRVLYRRVEKG